MYEELAGKTVFSARARMVELLAESGDLDGPPRPVTRPVKFYERGDRPLEIVTSGQWYIRNGGRDASVRARLLAAGQALTWHPAHMRVRYENWVSGLAGDWLISRQRFFGVPFPVWYPVDASGSPVYASPIVPDESMLPVDPASEPAPGYAESQRGAPGGFVADPDVMDTWATSSLTPLITSRWGTDDDLFARVFPMDLRAQSHEIIRTWLFSTVVRSQLEFGALPLSDAAISGWILDPDRKKMSKSKGNVVTPIDLLEQYGSDAVRYWSASGRYGVDTAFDLGQLKVGRRLAVKILNASKFVLSVDGHGRRRRPATGPAGRSRRRSTGRCWPRSTTWCGRRRRRWTPYDHAGALEATERFFWMFCDDYLELVKARAYGSGAGAASARGALRTALSVLLRLFAPFLPFVTEEVWSWWQEGSVHRASWPAGGRGIGSGSASARRRLRPLSGAGPAILRCSRPRRSCSARSGRRSRRRRSPCGPRRRGSSCGGRRRGGRRRARQRGRPAGGRQRRRLLVRPRARRRAGDRGHAGGPGYLLSRGSGPVGSRGIGRVVDWSLGSEPVAGPNRSTARSPTSW